MAQRIVQIFNRVHFIRTGFIELPLNDQMKLLQMTWAELLTIQLAYHSIPYTGKLMFAKEFWLDEKLAKECGASELFTHVRDRPIRRGRFVCMY